MANEVCFIKMEQDEHYIEVYEGDENELCVTMDFDAFMILTPAQARQLAGALLEWSETRGQT